jgi:hypothetical protein
LHFAGKSTKIYGMKRLFLLIFVVLLLLGSADLLKASELEVIAGVNGLTFQPDKTTEYTETDKDKQFSSYFYGLININFRHNISEILNFCLNIERDNILQNSINTVFGAKTDYFSVKFGPFFGLTDKFDLPDAGITGNLEFTIPGAVLLSINGASTLGNQYGFTSNNYRKTAGIKLGFWMGNTIPSFSANFKSLSRQIEESLFVDDSLFKLLFNLEFYSKNSNISGYINYGYQEYTRVYRKGGLESSDELSSLLAGFGLNWQTTRHLSLKIGFEIPFTFSAAEPMTVTSEFWFLSKAYAGFVYSVDK